MRGIRVIDGMCPFCDKAIEPHDYVTRCSVCGAVHHESCWLGNGRCTTFGCSGKPTKVVRASALMSETLVSAAAPNHGSVGMTCPFCQTPVKPGAQIATCPECGIPHHQECWKLNGACTTFGCKGTAGIAAGGLASSGAARDVPRRTGASAVPMSLAQTRSGGLSNLDLTSAVCPYCGGDVASAGEHGQSKCKSCGVDLELDAVGQVETRVVCAGCGKELPSGVVWCPECNG